MGLGKLATLLREGELNHWHFASANHRRARTLRPRQKRTPRASILLGLKMYMDTLVRFNLATLSLNSKLSRISSEAGNP